VTGDVLADLDLFLIAKTLGAMRPAIAKSSIDREFASRRSLSIHESLIINHKWFSAGSNASATPLMQ
jgi:hypothetical protein